MALEASRRPLPLVKPNTTAQAADIRARITSALDVCGRPFARPAIAWKREADRRQALRTPNAVNALNAANRTVRDLNNKLGADRRHVKKLTRVDKPNVLPVLNEALWLLAWTARQFNSDVRDARQVTADTRRARTEAIAARTEARANCPEPLGRRTAQAMTATAVPVTGVQVWAGVEPVGALTSTALMCGALVGAYGLGRRHHQPDTPAWADPQYSPIEQRLLARLDAWTDNAEARGLHDLDPWPAKMTEAGIRVEIKLGGKWTVETLRAALPQVRALLHVPDSVKTSVNKAGAADRAVLLLRTRSAADHLDMTGWKPGDPWAVSTEGGAAIPVPLGKRILLAGTSGSGKSWSARPLLAEASDREDHRLVIFDRKHVEARNWEHRARTACELDDMSQVMAELIAEGETRLKTLPRGQDVVPISPGQPRITVFVDEMAELLADCKKDHDDVIEGMRTIARKYRAAEIILVAATQKPALSGPSPGLDSQIAGQLTVRLSLAVSTSTEARVVFGDDATEKGWNAHELPMPGVALLRDQDKGPKSLPVPFRMRAMSPADVIALPDRPVWRLDGAVEEAPDGPVKPTGVDREVLLLAKLRELQPVSVSALAAATQIPKGTVDREVKRLDGLGVVEKTAEGWRAVGGA